MMSSVIKTRVGRVWSVRFDLPGQVHGMYGHVLQPLAGQATIVKETKVKLEIYISTTNITSDILFSHGCTYILLYI